MHALDKRDHPLEPDEGAGELQLISPDRDLRIGGGQGLKAAAEQGCLVFCGGGRPRFQGERVQVADVARLQDGGAAPDQLARPTAHL